MRRIIGALCAVALAACSESNAPTAMSVPHVAAGDTSLEQPVSPVAPVRPDPRGAAQLIEAALTAGITKVELPADSFSLAPDAVHPDMACPPESWNSAKCWLLYTPYLHSDNAYENPAILFAANDTLWRTPAGVLNPIVPYPGFGRYNSDPDHAFDPATHRLVQIYRVVNEGFNNIMIMSTGDARHWTTPSLVFRERNHDAVSPSLVIDPDRTAKIWYVRSGEDGCQAKTTTVQLRTARPDLDNSYEGAAWSDATPVNLSLPNAVIWHLDVAAVPGGYIALIAAFTPGSSCGYSDLWLSTSVDGLTWRSYAIPILWRGMKFARQNDLSTWYRGTLRYDAATDSLHLWPSALSDVTWTIYHTGMALADLKSALESARVTDLPTLARTSPRRSLIRAVEMP